jgi:hypothetical protein
MNCSSLAQKVQYRSILGHQGSGLAAKLQQFRTSLEGADAQQTHNKPRKCTSNAPVERANVVSAKFSNYDHRISAIIISFIGHHRSLSDLSLIFLRR